MNEPVGDSARSILDGHVVLSRNLASAGHFPCVEVLDSVSRVSGAITSAEQQAAAIEFRRLLAAYRDAKDLIEIGAYVKGTNPTVDHSVELRPVMLEFLRQSMDERANLDESWHLLGRIAGAAATSHPQLVQGQEARP